MPPGRKYYGLARKSFRGIKPLGMSTRFPVLTFLAVGAICGAPGHAQINVTSPTTEWTTILYPGTFSDYPLDVQATSIDLDIVGDGDNPGFYSRFDNGGTDTLGTDGWLGFRLRLAGDQSPLGFSGQAWVGADVDGNGSLDIFIGTNASTISIHDAGTGANTSPSTTSIESTAVWSTAATADLYDWSPVSVSLDPPITHFDIDNDNKPDTDHFLTFVVPFAELVAAVETLTGLTAFNDASSLAYVAATASQGQTLNSDLNAVDGGVNSSISWTDLGGITPTLGVDGEPYAVPEPSLAALLLGLASLGIFVVRKRRPR